MVTALLSIEQARTLRAGRLHDYDPADQLVTLVGLMDEQVGKSAEKLPRTKLQDGLRQVAHKGTTKIAKSTKQKARYSYVIPARNSFVVFVLFVVYVFFEKEQRSSGQSANTSIEAGFPGVPARPLSLWLGVAAVNNLQAPAEVIRKVGLLAMIGFGVVMLSGPILALLSVALSFALVLLPFVAVGLLVWLPFRYLWRGREVTIQDVHEIRQNVGTATGGIWRAFGRTITFLPRMAGRLVAFVFSLAWGILRLVLSTTRVLIEMSMVTLTGAFIGVAAGILSGQDLAVAIPTNAVAGGLIGAGAGLVMLIRERRTVAVRSPQVAV